MVEVAAVEVSPDTCWRILGVICGFGSLSFWFEVCDLVVERRDDEVEDLEVEAFLPAEVEGDFFRTVA